MFWADTVNQQAGPRPVQSPGSLLLQPKQLIVTRAVLRPNAGDADLYLVSLKNPERFGDKELFICKLDQQHPHINLNLHFDNDDAVAFIVRGPGTVYLTGHTTLKYQQQGIYMY